MKKLLTVITALLAFASVSAQNDVQTEKKKTRTAYLHGPIYDSFTKAAIEAKIVLMKTMKEKGYSISVAVQEEALNGLTWLH